MRDSRESHSILQHDSRSWRGLRIRFAVCEVVSLVRLTLASGDVSSVCVAWCPPAAVCFTAYERDREMC